MLNTVQLAPSGACWNNSPMGNASKDEIPADSGRTADCLLIYQIEFQPKQKCAVLPESVGNLPLNKNQPPPIRWASKNLRKTLTHSGRAAGLPGDEGVPKTIGSEGAPTTPGVLHFQKVFTSPRSTASMTA